MESRIFEKDLSGIEIKKPVFITALPRAGTTLLLNLCVETDELVSATYRDMPFLLTPLFWSRFSGLFKGSRTSYVRAHDDGMTINADSPEAFEEVLWKCFWPSHYKKDRIMLWSESGYPVFEKFLRDHLRKIILSKRDSLSPQARYISKNNLNIARIGYLKRVFPDSVIVVPFRAPLQHAASLLHQHRNFLEIHGQDAFARKFMENIGHYDFGKNLRPVDFNAWLSSDHAADPDTLSFWIQYWISAYGYLLKKARDRIAFISYDSLCADPERSLKQFGKILEIKNIGTLMDKAGLINPPREHFEDACAIPAGILDQAQALYGELQKKALN